MDYEKKYNELVEAIKQLQETNPSDEGIQNWANDVLYETKEAENERIRKALIAFIKKRDRSGCDYDYDKWIAWLEKQVEQTNFPQFTFDDVLALQCCMETVKKVQEDKELYKALTILHDKVYDAYHLEKASRGEAKMD